VIPALIRKAHDCKTSGASEMTIWGTGQPRREFLHVDDCADAVVHLMKIYSGAMHINIGAGEDLTIRDLAMMVADVVGFRGDLVFDSTKPDGTPRKWMSVRRLSDLGWTARTPLREGLAATYAHWLEHGGSDTRRASQAAAPA
jgi:GDP-L-fucose synthase